MRRTKKKKFRVAIIYNAYDDSQQVLKGDQSSPKHLKLMVRRIARALRRSGHEVIVIPLIGDLPALERKLARINPDVIFNQYDDVVHDALYEMRIAAFIHLLGYKMTGSPALALGISRHKFMAASLLSGVGIPIPSQTTLIERLYEIDSHDWQFPLIVHPAQAHSGVGIDRNSVVTTKKALREKVRELINNFNQPALVQHFLPGREFNVGLIGGRKLRVLPLAEVDYSRLPLTIPPIMSYAAKWVATSVEYKKTRVTCPAKVDPGLERLISSTAIKAFRAIGGWGYGRVDIRLDETGLPRVLEVNCNPCLDEGMGLARSAARAGISYQDLLNEIITAAFEGPPYDVMLPIFNSMSNRRKK